MGKVYLVGAGPGDPKLLTIYGLECIQRADVILYDRLVNPQLLEAASPQAELIFCGKLPGQHALIQDTIHRLLIEKAQAGKTVVRLKGGDPFVFGRGGEEAQTLRQHDIDFEIVPGVTAGIAVPAYAGIPVTHRGYSSSFALVTGHGRADQGQDVLNWPALARGIDTIVFYMAMGNLKYICAKLIEHGRDAETPAACIEWGATVRQRTISGCLRNIAQRQEQANIRHPAIFIVGNCVGLRSELAWFE